MPISNDRVKERDRAIAARRAGRTVPFRKITPKQIRALWGYANRLRIPEEDLREWISRRTGKHSLRALTRPQASRLIEEIARKWEANGRPAVSPHPMTLGQARILRTLEGDIGWDDRRLFGLAKKMYRIERLQDLQPKEAAGLIEAMKAIRRRKTA